MSRLKRILNPISSTNFLDLILVRDLLFHLSYSDITRVFKSIARSESKYILFTSHTSKVNKNILTGNFREINFFNEPFNLNEDDVFDRIHESEDAEGYCNKELIFMPVKNLKKNKLLS